MKPLLVLCFGACAFVASAHAQSPLDRMLQNVAPVLEASEAYHMPEEAGEPLALTLERCVAIALEQNADVLRAGAGVALREAEAGQARARRRPQVAADTVYNYVEEVQTGIEGGILGGLVDTESFTRERAVRTTRLSITQVLYAGGQIHAAIKASRFLAESEAWRRDVARAEVAFQARQAYHDALLARTAVSVAEEAVSAFERHVRDTEILQAEGALTAYEVMRARTELAARRAEHVAAVAAVALADLNTRQILALPADQPLHYDPDITWRPIDGTADALIAEAREQRPELRALQKALEASQQNLRGVKATYLPEIGLSGTWLDIDGGGAAAQDGWQLDVAAEWEIYAGGRRKHERAAARARTDDLRFQLADLDRLVAVDVEQALVRAREAEAAMRASRESADLAGESIRLAQIRYSEGAGTQTEIIDTELAHTRARRDLAQAVHDVYLAHAALLRALGREPGAPAPEEEKGPAPADAETGP